MTMSIHDYYAEPTEARETLCHVTNGKSFFFNSTFHGAVFVIKFLRPYVTLYSIAMTTWVLVRILAYLGSAQPTQLSILPFRLVSKWVPEKRGKVNCGNLAVTCPVS